MNENFSRRSASFGGNDRLFFPKKIKKIVVDNRVIVLSPETANWLVLDEAVDVDILDRLISGETINEVVAFSGSINAINRLKMILSQISARDFATRDHAPVKDVGKSIKGAYFYLTNACNLHCKHCYMFSGKALKDELSVDEWLKAVDDFAAHGGTNITFSGGEVLAKQGWMQILKRAHEKGISSTVLTNGTLWKNEQIKEAASYLDEVQISLDGPTEAINSNVRGEGVFQKALAVAKLFSKEGIKTSIAMTPMRDNINSFAAHIESFVEQYIYGTGISIRIGQKLLLGVSVSPLAGEEKINYETTAGRVADKIYPSSVTRSFALNHLPNQVHENCGFGGLSVSADGKIYPCNRVGDVKPIGDLRTDDFDKINHHLMRCERETNVDNIEPCKWCDLRYVCGGGCRIDDFYISTEEGEKSLFRDAYVTERSVRKDNCSEQYRLSLLRRMIEMKDYLFLS